MRKDAARKFPSGVAWKPRHWIAPVPIMVRDPGIRRRLLPSEALDDTYSDN
jgi:hypothetical protein